MAKKATRKGMEATCPACGYDFHFRKLPKRGNHVNCPDCHSFLEVVRLAPLMLEWGFEDPFIENYLNNPDLQFDDDHQDGKEINTDYDDLNVEWHDGWEDDWKSDSDRL